ncbi:thrombospondin type 3 repeat-containing protein [Patescibacteria group bacterium]
MLTKYPTTIASIIVGCVVLITGVIVVFTVQAESPPVTPDAVLITPTAGSTVSGTLSFEANLGEISPPPDTVVSFTIYRLTGGGAPEYSRYCFLSPLATNIVGTRWRADNVDTMKVSGNCSDSLVGWGTVYTPENGTYRFGVWIDGEEYVTEDSITIDNGVAQVDPEGPGVNININRNTNTNQNTNTGNTNFETNQNFNTNEGSEVNANEDSSSPDPVLNINEGGDSPPGDDDEGAQQPSISFVSPNDGAKVQGTVNIVASVANVTQSEIQEVVFSVESRTVWYTMGQATQGSSGDNWTHQWNTTSLPDGTVFGVMRLYLSNGTIYGTEVRAFTIANTSDGSADDTQTNTNSGESNTNSIVSNTNEGDDSSGANTNYDSSPAPPTGRPPKDSDNDGIADVEEKKRGTDPNRPGAIVPPRRTYTSRPSAHPLTSGVEDDTLRVTKVTGPGIISSGEETENSYKFYGTGIPAEFLSLFIYSENPIVIPVQTNALGLWQSDANFLLEIGDHSAYVALLNNNGDVEQKSAPFAFTIDPDALKKSQGGSFPWVWVIVAVVVIGGGVVGFQMMGKGEEKK